MTLDTDYLLLTLDTDIIQNGRQDTVWFWYRGNSRVMK